MTFKDIHSRDVHTGTVRNAASHSREVRAMFARIAGVYDRMNHLLSLNLDRRWRHRLAARVEDGVGAVLDLCSSLAPIALVVILGYSYTKRFTAASHLVLGFGLAIAPVGAWLAVADRFDPFPIWIAAGILFWVAGFDAIYACQDVEFERKAGLRSVAVRFGVPSALRLSRLFRLFAVLCLAMAFSRPPFLGTVSLAGVAVMAAMLVHEQFLVRGGDLRRIDQAFFTVNSWIGMALLACVLIELYLV